MTNQEINDDSDIGELGSSMSITMLEGMLQRDPKQWDRFSRLFSPLVCEWCLRAKVDQQDTADVARELGMTVGAVYNAKYKVLQWLRAELDWVI